MLAVIITWQYSISAKYVLKFIYSWHRPQSCSLVVSLKWKYFVVYQIFVIKYLYNAGNQNVSKSISAFSYVLS